MSVRLSARISAVPTGRIYVKFDIDDFHEYLLEKSIRLKSGKISRTL